MRKITRISGIFFLNISLIAALLEILLRLTASSLPGSIGITARWITTGQPFAENWTPAWQQNRDHYYALRPGLDHAPQYGSPSVSFRLSTIELWEGGGIGFRTDPIDFFVDAVVVGDSFGMCFTERVDCWVDQFAAQTGLKVVNLSQPVTGTTSHYRILRDFGKFLEPPLVIWQFFGNDFNDDYGLAVFRGDLEEAEPDNPAQDEPSGMLEGLQRHSVLLAVIETLVTGRFSGVPAAEQVFVKPYRVTYGIENEHTLQFGGLYERQSLDMSRQANQIGLGLSRDALLAAQEMIAGWGGKLIVVIIPTREEVYAALTAPIMGEAELARLVSAREAMLTLCAEINLDCYDLYAPFAERALAGEALYYSDDMHLNPHGNAVMAAALTNTLQESRNP